MCQNARWLLFISHPKCARSATITIPSPIIVLQRDRKLQQRLLRWMALRHTHTYTLTPALILATHLMRSIVLFCIVLNQALLGSASGRSQPLLSSLFCCFGVNEYLWILSLFVTYTYIEEEKTLSIFRRANRARQVLFEFNNNKQP